jgi:hypothetical protein
MTTQQKALQDCITAMEKLLSAVKIDRHDTEDWPKDSRESLEQVKIALTQAKQALAHVPDAGKMVQAQADNHAKTYARNLCLHMKNKFYPDVAQFEPQEDILGMLTQIDNMVEGLVHPQASEPVGINGLTQAETDASMSVRGLSNPTASEPAEKRTLYECTGCGHLHNERVSSCDCIENPGNTYNLWTASPEAK